MLRMTAWIPLKCKVSNAATYLFALYLISEFFYQKNFEAEKGQKF